MLQCVKCKADATEAIVILLENIEMHSQDG